MKRILLAVATSVALASGCATEPGPYPLLGILTPATAPEARAPIDPPLQVLLQTEDGDTVYDTLEVTIHLFANSVGARLEGTTAARAVRGVATFSDLRIDRPGSGFMLGARTDGGSVPDRSEPFAVRATFLEGSATAGHDHSCAITVRLFAYCWGGNGQHRLGDDSYESTRNTPVPVSGNLNFVQVRAGDYHTCGLLGDGTAYCWGGNFSGQVGDDTREHKLVPAAVGGGLKFLHLSVGAEHTCAVASDNAAYCWGNGGAGRLGDGTTTSLRTVPTRVNGNLAFAEVSAGAGHTCAVTVDSLAYCWGWNNVGQLGDGSTESRDAPTPVLGGLKFLHVAAGIGHTCGLAADHQTYCWGLNGQPTPTAVAAGLSFRTLSVGSNYTCGVLDRGEAYCWGGNEDGQLGDGTTVTRLTPTPVAGGLSFSDVSAGWSHTCGVTTDKVAYCWGSNDFSKLGDSTYVSSLVPRRVLQ